ncbi:hypothetical protein LBMAG53_24110 [Planctomycetota bacterium]|nr:hypothetical protein LBMAG53_24110 [Planctomycetota bacterium]
MRPASQILLLAVIQLLGLGLAADPTSATQPRTLIPTEGKYQYIELLLVQAAPTLPPPGQYSIHALSVRGQDVAILAATRDGRIRVPSRLSVRDTIGELTVTDGSIQGIYPYQAHNSMAEKRYVISATVAAGQVAGTWKVDGGKEEGAITGRIHSESELRQRNAFTTKASWPQWHGPTTSFAADSCGLALVSDFNKDAVQVWRSEEPTPAGPGGVLNYEALALGTRSNGGGASLVVAEGKVVISYYQPAGEEITKGKVYLKGAPDYTPGIADDALAYLTKKNNIAISPFMREKWSIKADDVVVCMDAATGKTLWKTVFPLASINQPSHKGGCVNNTPCLGGGRVFARGTSGRLHALDLASGTVLWEVDGMSVEGVQPWSGARNQCTAPIYASGTLIVPDHGAGLIGLDPASGKILWRADGKSHRFQVPGKWSYQGQEYVISMGDEKIEKDQTATRKAFCIEPKSGRILWEIELPPNPNKGVSIHGDRMFVTALGILPAGWQHLAKQVVSANATVTAYALDPGKAQQLWQSPATFAAADAPPGCNGAYVVVGGPLETHLFDAATGKDLATYAGGGPYNEGYAAFFEDRILLSLDGSHGHSEMTILGASPETLTKDVHTWWQPHPMTTSYHNKFMTFPMVEGRIFFRGADGVYCYDLRKKRP